MKIKSTIENMSSNIWLLGSSCFLAYTACYAGRSILSAIMPQIILDSNYTRSELGAMGSAFFLAYGIGQILNGLIGDRIKAKYMVPVGLFFASVILMVFPSLTNVAAGIFLWGLCGVFLSMLWGPLSKVIAENTSVKVGTLLLTALNVASILGTTSAYLIATYSSSKEQWKLSFYVVGVILVLTAVIWYLMLSYLEKRNALKVVHLKKAEGFNKELLNVLLNNAIIPMLVVSMINGIIRNAVTFWIPTYITEELGFSPTLSAGISGILPFVNLVGTFIGLYILNRLGENEFKTIAILFATSLFMFLSIGIISAKHVVFIIGMLFIACATMSSASNIIFSTYCLKFKETGRISAVNGLINFSSYAASAGASVLFSKIITKYNWNLTVLVWAMLSLVGVAFSLIAQKQFDRQRPKVFESNQM